MVCGLGTTFINAPRFECPGGIRPSEVHVFGGRIATQIASMVEMRLFWLVTSSVLRANLLNSKCSCWLNIQIYDEVLNFPSFLLATTSRFMAEHRHFSWLNSKFFLGSPRYFLWPRGRHQVRRPPRNLCGGAQRGQLCVREGLPVALGAAGLG